MLCGFTHTAFLRPNADGPTTETLGTLVIPYKFRLLRFWRCTIDFTLEFSTCINCLHAPLLLYYNHTYLKSKNGVNPHALMSMTFGPAADGQPLCFVLSTPQKTVKYDLFLRSAFFSYICDLTNQPNTSWLLFKFPFWAGLADQPERWLSRNGKTKMFWKIKRLM